MSNHHWIIVLATGAMLAAAPSARAQSTAMPASLDDEFSQLAEQVPGFGGLYLDADGTTHVYLTDLSRAGEVQDLGKRVAVEPADYDFRDLHAWKQALRQLLAQRGALSLDIDENRNRLLFNVEMADLEAFTATLGRFLARLRVPKEAVLVEPSEPDVVQELLTDKMRPVPAGSQISPGCTLGANAHLLGAGAGAGFVTASHCTASQGVLDGTIFFQNDPSPASNRVGVETFDPQLFTGGPCPLGRKCRFSDAAFVAYDSTADSAGGQIANAMFCGTFAPQSTLVNGFLPRLPVTAVTLANSLSGTVLTKVGKTSGCTFGTLQRTCEDTNAFKRQKVAGGLTISVDTGITLLCQNRVGAFSAPGDSGSPVFIRNGNEATLAGILWGGNGTGFSYSPWLWVATELGAVPDLQ
jgi:hypothetical protein